MFGPAHTFVKENTTREIDLRNDDPSAVDSMIHYFYTLVYPDEVDFHDPVTLAANAESKDHPQEEDRSAEATDSIPESQSQVVQTNEAPPDSIDKSQELVQRHLHKDLLVYALADKYGVTDLKEKAARHFDEMLGHGELSLDIFDIVREVYSTTQSHDRGLRDIVIAKVHSEIQHWTGEMVFMETLASEGEFCADLLHYTVKQDMKHYEAALATIEHPGYCETCSATLIVKKWMSKRKNLTTKTYCARCEPWG